jgi:ArsR family metal-binding transcriptional regulator
MLIDDFELELSTPECDLASAVYKADIHLSADISEVLPYLNATLERAEFIPGMPVLVWTEGGHRYALRPHEIAISTILEKKEANELAYALVRRINKVWEDRANIEPTAKSAASRPVWLSPLSSRKGKRTSMSVQPSRAMSALSNSRP